LLATEAYTGEAELDRLRERLAFLSEHSPSIPARVWNATDRELTERTSERTRAPSS
jgi:hypothetical protein